MTVVETVQTTLASFWQEGFGVSSRLWPLYLIATLILGYGLYLLRGVKGSFLAWLMPRSVWTHPSHVVDIKLFALFNFLSVAGVFPTVVVAAVVTSAVSDLFPRAGPGAGLPHPMIVAAMLLIVGDFATYWVHRIHHEMRTLWPFHSVHHSAEVMTPVTVYRKHPIYHLTNILVHGALLGVLQGVLVGLFPGGVSIAALMGVNAGYFLFNMLGANFRHSHIWLGYGRILEHVLISPAQHQVHHSIAPQHHNKNYGEVLAVWDWMFGTLYVTGTPEHIEFGLGDADGNRLQQRHDSLTAALVVPVQDSWKQFLKRFFPRNRAPHRPVTPSHRGNDRAMGPGFSAYLNALRFGAAMVVLLSHFAYPRFSNGAWLWVRELNLGSDAVVLFFVLSGFVIALTAERKDTDLRSYAFARATRILSVALPALVLGWALDRWGAAQAPEQYFQPYYNPLPLWDMLMRGLSFSNEWNGLATRLGSNGPFWSLSYEVAYYALFGVAVYLTGMRRVILLVAGVALTGLNILLLMPAWLMGVWLYHRLKQGARQRPTIAVVLAGLPVALYAIALRFDLPDILQTTVQPHLPGHALRFSEEFLWNALLGVLVCTHLSGVTALLRYRTAPRLSSVIAWLAGASFSMYLMHYPLLQALHAALPGLGHAGLFFLTLLICFAFAELFERPLHRWRRLLRGSGALRRTRVTD